MKKSIYLSAGVMIAAIPYVVFAHEHRVYMLDNQRYEITVGSINEPLVVDDKSGLDLMVTKGGGAATMSADGDMDGPAVAAKPVEGLDKTLKVEMSAGNQKKVMDISPVYGKPGGYKTTFFPTVQTTFSYRLFGAIDGAPVDLVFTCNPAGHPQSPEDTNVVTMSDHVKQVSKAGAFGCALAKEDLGFPEKVASAYDTQNSIAAVRAEVEKPSMLAIVGVVLGALGVSLALILKKKNAQ